MKRHGNFKLSVSLCLSLILVLNTLAAMAAPTDVRMRTLSKSVSPSTPKRKPPLKQIGNSTEGQSSTLLSDGSALLLGGIGPNGPTDEALLRDQHTGRIAALVTKMHIARAWHTATTLPDGTILILGGLDSANRIVARAELFDPATRTFGLVPLPNSIPARARHTATLLLDGSVLIVGGVAANGKVQDSAVILDGKGRSFITLSSSQNIARQNHKATLLGDGRVLLEGGEDSLGNVIRQNEAYNPESRSFTWGTGPVEPIDDSAAFLTASLPNDRATDVSVDSAIGLLFSRQLRPETVSPASIELTGPEGTVTIKVIAAEQGKSAFVTPQQPLAAGVEYNLLITGCVDRFNHSIVPAVVTFTTAGEPDRRENPNAPDLSGSADSDQWIPDSRNRNGNWRTNSPESHWQKLPPLQAPPGVTALAGRVLTVDGKPLANVTLQINDISTRTDNTGRFLLQSITPGHQVLKIDGHSADVGPKVYGIFRVGIDITGGKTDVLSYTIWMPRLDVEHATTISSPTNGDVVCKTPFIPGLELRLPAGTLIRGIDGDAVTQVTITPIPVDRPPFPLPSGINVPVFFTIQPGGAQIIPPRASVVYPNYTQERPGSRIDFWNYDPAEKGWYIYGRGTVTEDGRQVVPDSGVSIYEFSGVMINTGENPPSDGPVCDTCEDGDPVDLGTGLLVNRQTDLSLPDVMPLELTRTYRPRDTASRPFGIGSTFAYQMFLWSAQQYQEADLVLPDGSRIHFERVSTGTSFTNARFLSTATPGPFYGAELRWVGIDPQKIEMWNLTLQDGTVYVFGDTAPLQRIRDRHGNTINISRAGINSFGSPTGNITRVTSPSGKYIDFTYDTSNRIIKAKDSAAREVNYTYDANGRLWKVTDPNGGITEYTYDSSNRMLTIKDPRGIVYLTNEYDTNGRVIKQTLADDTPAITTDNPKYQFAYTTDSAGKIIQTDVTDPRGIVNRVTFNSDGYWLTDTLALGRPEQQTFSVERQFKSNLILNATDPLGRKTAYTYDSRGRYTSVTRLALTSEALTTTYSYLYQNVDHGFPLPTTITDPLRRVATHLYDLQGSLVSATDAAGRSTRVEYNENGLPTSVTDPSGNTVRIGYQTKIPTSITDALGRSITRHEDAAGRTMRITNAAGQSVRYEFDSLNHLMKAVNPVDGVIQYSYDANGNLLTVQDQRQKLTSLTYDNLDRLKTRTDQLQGTSSVESFEYDLNGNVQKFTDRKGKVTVYQYDGLNRLTFIGFGQAGVGQYESTISYTYDAGNRLRTAVDSISGTITLDYDNFDRLISETNPQGSVVYTYDKLGRRKTMTASGQAVVNYTYDDADRLVRISQGPSTIDFTYDDSDRLTSKTLPNGVVEEYSYDAAYQLIGITYRLGDTILGDLTYKYDAAGQRVETGGSFARTTLPQPLNSVTYDDANRLIQREASTLTYDNNGNLTSDGINTYTWDARNHLTLISGSVTASFQYDAFGRRVSKTVNGVSTAFLFDGINVVQEQVGGGISASLLVAGIDGVFTRGNATETHALITDGLGSILGLTNGAGALQTEYTYEPFGKTSVTGTAADNVSQYTGRENDGATGLYFNRARYYSPTLQRFISEDPIGFDSGDLNLYAYVGNDPINFTDPIGLQEEWGGLLGWLNNKDPKEKGWWGGVKAGLRYGGLFFPPAHIAARVIDVAEGDSIGISDVLLLGGAVVSNYSKVRQLGSDAHHIIQDAAVRDVPGYSRSAAPATILVGPSTKVGSPHYCATQVQRQLGGGTYAAERRIGYKALRRAGMSSAESRDLIKKADDYFHGLGVTPQTTTRIPGNRH